MSTDADYCEMSDLPHDQCDHCRRKAKRIERDPDVDPRPEAIGDVFVAKFHGSCIECREEIIKGDHIALVKEVLDERGKVKYSQYAHYGCTSS